MVELYFYVDVYEAGVRVSVMFNWAESGKVAMCVNNDKCIV